MIVLDVKANSAQPIDACEGCVLPGVDAETLERPFLPLIFVVVVMVVLEDTVATNGEDDALFSFGVN